MSSSIMKQIAGLQRLSVPDLKQRWRKLFGTAPPAHQRRFMVKRLAYRIQEFVYGGLTYAPEVDVTRDQMAVYVQRAFQLPV